MSDYADRSWVQSAEALAGELTPLPAYPQSDGPESAGVVDRRDFLRASGFALAGAGLAGAGVLSGCSAAPVKRAVPLLAGVEGQIPGKATYYATVCGGCSAGCGVLAKVRDGRPIKLEGLPGHPLSQGGLCAMGQAYLLGLYDSHRLAAPQLAGQATNWNAVDAKVRQELDAIAAQGGAVRVLAHGLSSPTLRAQIAMFLRRFTDGRLVEYDPCSVSAIRAAHLQTHGARLLPTYRLERAETIVSFDADFLGTWINPVAFAAGWRQGRQFDSVRPRSSRVIQVESRMSMTGAKADTRLAESPDGIARGLRVLAGHVAALTGIARPLGLTRESDARDAIYAEIARELVRHCGRSLVISGLNDLDTQLLVNYVNGALGNYGATVDIDRPLLTQTGDDTALEALLTECESGRVGALFVVGGNPLAELPERQRWTAALNKVPLTVSCSSYHDETAALCTVVCPDHHPLEGWSDVEPQAGLCAIRQPTINSLRQTRSALESFARWSGDTRSAIELLQAHWAAAIFPRQLAEATPELLWNRALATGYVVVDTPLVTASEFAPETVRLLGSASRVSPDALWADLHPSIALGDGRHAQNPWLQELPDPISKVTWDNVAAIAPSLAHELGVATGDLVRIEADGVEPIELPVLIQPGQHERVVSIALGYGRKGSERFAQLGPRWIERRESAQGPIGANAAGLLQVSAGMVQSARSGIRIVPTGRHRDLALTQQHHVLETPRALLPAGSAERPIVRNTTLAALPTLGEHEEHAHHAEGEMWARDHENTGPKWGMVIDLAACTGCSGCVIACQAENNIPVVGRDEVRRGREMHWIRLDRYYATGDEGIEVAHQPMLCQQCGHAPCETVCPVLATVHSEDGLNQQVYNRCVGTRYCANNCPYKTRRFNWFDYPHEDPIENLVLNPDVTVRSRGVMEKCTFCVQRIQEARIAASAAGTPIADGAIQPACQQSCPAQAITFGNLNEPASAVSRAMASTRQYQVLKELNVQPSVGYLQLVRNPLGREGGEHG